jgi:hypothetical protein
VVRTLSYRSVIRRPPSVISFVITFIFSPKFCWEVNFRLHNDAVGYSEFMKRLVKIIEFFEYEMIREE